MKIKKSFLLFSVLMLLFVFTSSAVANDGAWGANKSTPALTAIYYPNTWSNGTLTWDLRNNSVPDNAIVKNIMVRWTTFPDSG